MIVLVAGAHFGLAAADTRPGFRLRPSLALRMFMLAGALIAGVFGWLILTWVRAVYERKQISDNSDDWRRLVRIWHHAGGDARQRSGRPRRFLIHGGLGVLVLFYALTFLGFRLEVATHTVAHTASCSLGHLAPSSPATAARQPPAAALAIRRPYTGHRRRWSSPTASCSRMSFSTSCAGD